jgi:hypothetical protein
MILSHSIKYAKKTSYINHYVTYSHMYMMNSTYFLQNIQQGMNCNLIKRAYMVIKDHSISNSGGGSS